MTAHPLTDQPRLLPADPAWILEAEPLQTVLGLAARAAEVRPEPFRPLHTTAYDAAAALLAQSVAAVVLHTPDNERQRVLPVPVYQLQALTSVRTELARARDDEPGTEGLRNLMLFYGGYIDQTPESLLALLDRALLDRALAVLALDLPAVHTVALALLARRTPDPDAYAQIAAAWKKAGVAP